MNSSARWLSMFYLLFLLISGVSARAEDQPMARAVLPPPLPASPPAAQSVPAAAAAPEEQRVAKPAAERVPTEDRKHQTVHRAGISPGALKRGAAADRPASSSLKKADRAGNRELQPHPPEQIVPGQRVAGAMPFSGPPPTLFRYYSGYPPGFVPYAPAYQYPWLPGPSLPR